MKRISEQIHKHLRAVTPDNIQISIDYPIGEEQIFIFEFTWPERQLKSDWALPLAPHQYTVKDNDALVVSKEGKILLFQIAQRSITKLMIASHYQETGQPINDD